MAFPHAPADWSKSTSEEHWVPSKETRDEIARLLKLAVKEPRAKQRATWKKALALLPPALRKIIGNNSPGWGLVASHEVAAAAMALIHHASKRNADPARIQRELERILPDLPMISLNGVVDGDEFIAAVDAIKRDGSRACDELLSYLSSS